MGQQRLTCLRAVAGDHVEHAGRDAGLLRQRRHPQCREWRLLGGLEHDRAAGGERRGDLLCGHQHRVVPRHDQPAHTDRFLDDQAHRLRTDGRDIARDLGRPAGVVLEHERHFVDVELGITDRLPAVAHLELGQLPPMLTDQLGDPQQQARPLAGGDRVPPRAVIEGAPGGDDGEIDIVGSGPRQRCEHGTGRRIDRVETLPARATRPRPRR